MKAIQIRMAGDGPGQQFVEVETDDGKSITIGTWKRDGEYQLLQITADDLAKVGAVTKLEGAIRALAGAEILWRLHVVPPALFEAIAGRLPPYCGAAVADEAKDVVSFCGRTVEETLVGIVDECRAMGWMGEGA